MKTTVIIPTYNEAENIRKLIPILLELSIENLHILVVDDNSRDNTGKIADEFAGQTNRVKVLHRHGKLGLGTAYIQGFQIALDAGSDAVIQMDADFSHPPHKIPELIEQIAHYDLVIGSRYVAGGNVDTEWAAWRKALSAFGNTYARTILSIKTRDITGGFRIFRADTLRKMPIQDVRSNGYIYQVEMTYIASKMGFSIGEIPIYFAEREWGDSKMSFKIQAEAALRTWKLLWDYRNLEPLND